MADELFANFFKFSFFCDVHIQDFQNHCLAVPLNFKKNRGWFGTNPFPHDKSFHSITFIFMEVYHPNSNRNYIFFN